MIIARVRNSDRKNSFFRSIFLPSRKKAVKLQRRLASRGPRTTTGASSSSHPIDSRLLGKEERCSSGSGGRQQAWGDHWREIRRAFGTERRDGRGGGASGGRPACLEQGLVPDKTAVQAAGGGSRSVGGEEEDGRQQASPADQHQGYSLVVGYIMK